MSTCAQIIIAYAVFIVSIVAALHFLSGSKMKKDGKMDIDLPQQEPERVDFKRIGFFKD